MAKAIFVCPFTEGKGPDLDIDQLVGNPPTDGYGWSCVGHVPQAPTCLVLIASSEDVLDELAADDRYLFLEDVTDLPVRSLRRQVAKLTGKRAQKTKAVIKIYLKNRGHKAADVDGELDTRTVGAALLKLHGVTAEQYRNAGGRGA